MDSEVLSPRVPNQQLQQDIISLAELREAADSDLMLHQPTAVTVYLCFHPDLGCFVLVNILHIYNTQDLRSHTVCQKWILFVLALFFLQVDFDFLMLVFVRLKWAY